MMPGLIWARIAAVAIPAVALLGFLGFVRYDGVNAGRAEVAAVLEAERAANDRAIAKFQTEAAAAAATSAARHQTTLTNLKDSHDRTTTALRTSLARSELRVVALGRELAGLHDAAARAGSAPSAPGDAVPPGSEAGAAPGPTVADLLEVVNANYAICHRTASQLVALQDWYESLRAGSEVTR